MNPRIKLFVVDDHPIVREGIISLLKENSAYEIVGEASNGKEALALIGGMNPLPEVVLMDITMPVMDGVVCTGELFKQYNGRIKVLTLTMMNQSLHIRSMLEAGASGYILKNCDKTELFDAIDPVYRGETYFSQAVSREVMNEMTKVKIAGHTTAPVELSKRELEVLQLIVKDMSNQQIADALYISIRTVETHKLNMISKTATNNVAGLVVYAIKNRLVDIT